ncbi:MAG: HAD family hydrolase [Solirubrobacteraceae bacterium]
MAIAILDIDGTLVDTNYQHALAWFRALARFDLIVPIWRIHRHTGMGGDQIVSALCGEEIERELGGRVRAAHDEEYGRMIGEVRTVAGARELILALGDRGHRTVLASSANKAEVDHYLELLDAREIVAGWTTSADVEATKPAPDLVHAARKRAGASPNEPAVMVGDTPWDVRAALAADVGTLAVITGGFSEQELREAGALDVFESVAQLTDALDRTPLGRDAHSSAAR